MIVFGAPVLHETLALNDVGEMDPARWIGLVSRPASCLVSKLPWGALKLPALNDPGGHNPGVAGKQIETSMNGLNSILKLVVGGL